MNIQNYYGNSGINRTQFQRVLVLNNVNANQSGGVDSIFQKYDLDKNGILSNNEMKKLMQDYNIEQKSDDGTKTKNILEGIGGLLGGLTNAATGIFGAITASKGNADS